MNSMPTSNPSARTWRQRLHLALHPQDLAVELQREVVDGADLEGGREVEERAPRLRSSSRAGTWARAVPVSAFVAHAPARWRSRSRNDSRSARSSASTFTNEMPTW